MKGMAEHKRNNSKMKVYFPYSLWKIGMNKNTNGLIRQFFGIGFSKANS